MKNRSAQCGLSIIELLIGLAVGLFIVGGALKLFTDYLRDSRTSLLEVRLNQDLRAAADLIARDIRRAGYWRNSTTGVWSESSTSVVTNPYTAVFSSISSGTSIPECGGTPSSQIEFSYATDADDAVSSTTENFGFRRNASTGALQFSLGNGTYQDLTDVNSIDITQFSICAVSPARVVELYESCPCLSKGTCTAATFVPAGAASYNDRPRLTIQQFVISLSGRSRSDTSIQREIRETVRVRNDKFEGSACVN